MAGFLAQAFGSQYILSGFRQSCSTAIQKCLESLTQEHRRKCCSLQETHCQQNFIALNAAGGSENILLTISVYCTYCFMPHGDGDCGEA